MFVILDDANTAVKSADISKVKSMVIVPEVNGR
jgi:hypothetical protein